MMILFVPSQSGSPSVSGEASFRDLILRVRAGDEAAAAELVRRYEPAIRRTVRVRLRDPRLGRVLDSLDICQSVLASFFVRAALGQYELDRPEQLLKLLTVMARHKLANQAHRERAQRRDCRRIEEGPDQEQHLLAAGASPSEQVTARELLEEARRRLTPAERQLLELRQQGHEWADIGRELGGTPAALRMQLTRAVERVSQELGLDEERHE
jgi:RNA polymerase sigma-70 factor (ECF subfamily)